MTKVPKERIFQVSTKVIYLANKFLRQALEALSSLYAFMKGGIDMPEQSVFHLKRLLLLPDNIDMGTSKSRIDKIIQTSRVFRELYLLENQLTPILSGMQKSGLLLSRTWLSEGLQQERLLLLAKEAEIQSYTGNDVGVTPEEKLVSFLKVEKLPEALRIADLKKNKALHPIYAVFMQYKVTKQFIDFWGTKLERESQKDSRGELRLKGQWASFTSFSGRIFASDLPLTSLPRGMRPYIRSEDDRCIYSLDFNQAELRFVAYYSRCEALLLLINERVDLHQQLGNFIASQAATTAHLTEEKARQIGKQFLFSFLYGAGKNRLLQNLQKHLPEMTSIGVERIANAFYTRFPALQIFLRALEKEDTLLTPFGLVKPLAKFTQHQKRNFSFQAGVAVAIKKLMICLHPHFEIIHVVHDELWVLAYPEDRVLLDTMINQFYEEMTVILPKFPTKGFVKIKLLGGI
ncbi:hypothetical protein HCC18_16765 [Listeria booriae]|uniref:DNA polymerase n=1 Tax=Listeria booriae TaxID=1552123 RepID=UPI00162859E9|nr:DNA polymerase [Listeria booriae]MBC2318499.1 hypothetical protein [Listeria booriae]MCD2205562.1 hypothetical protein [Listeria booriae]